MEGGVERMSAKDEPVPVGDLQTSALCFTEQTRHDSRHGGDRLERHS